MHLTDWLPTFADYAGLDIPNSEFADIALDGYSFRDAFENGADSPRSDLFHHVDESRVNTKIVFQRRRKTEPDSDII